MSAPKFAPGPWFVRVPSQGDHWVVQNNAGMWLEIPPGPHTANLVAQAPEMFEALRGLSKRGLLRCRHDVLNPCTLSKVPGKHWSGLGDACDECRASLALARVVAGEPCRWCKGTGRADSEGCNACDGSGRAGT